MLWMRWMVRAARWAHHPPPMWKVLVVLAVIAFCVGIVALDKAGLWPAWLHVNSGPRMRMRLP